MTDQLKKPSKLIVVVAFSRDDEGTMQPSFGPIEHVSEERAVRAARLLASKFEGVIARSRDADPVMGEYGPPTTLFVHGDVPDME